MVRSMFPIVLAAALCVAPTNASAQGTRSDSSAATAAVEGFHAALAARDSVRAVALLANDAMILESGAIQSRAEYLSHHLGADMKAMQGSKGVRTVVQTRVVGDAAYIVSKTLTPPSGAEGSTASESVELMVLSRAGSGWSIRAVHWSSRRRR